MQTHNAHNALPTDSPRQSPYLPRLIGTVENCSLHASRLGAFLDRALGARPEKDGALYAAQGDTLDDLEARLGCLVERLESLAQRADMIA